MWVNVFSYSTPDKPPPYPPPPPTCEVSQNKRSLDSLISSRFLWQHVCFCNTKCNNDVVNSPQTEQKISWLMSRWICQTQNSSFTSINPQSAGLSASSELHGCFGSERTWACVTFHLLMGQFNEPTSSRWHLSSLKSVWINISRCIKYDRIELSLV